MEKQRHLFAGSKNPTDRRRTIVWLMESMIEERIQRTESAVKTAENISADEKAELLGLLAKLKSALEKVSQTHHEDAQSIARFAEASTHEAMRKKKKTKLLKEALHGLKQSVEEI
jgi:hypothetical protein